MRKIIFNSFFTNTIKNGDMKKYKVIEALLKNLNSSTLKDILNLRKHPIINHYLNYYITKNQP